MTTTNKTVKLGYIGTGIAARELHWPAILQLGEKFSIQAVCNRTRSKAEDFARLTNATRIYDTVDELLNDDTVEAVVIAAPIELNYSLVKQALEYRKHVMVEKPLAASVEEARELLNLEKQTDKVILLAENFRYHPAFREIAKIIAQGQIGEVFSFFWNGYGRLIPGDKYATAWRLNNQYPGGYVMDSGIHNVAAIRLLFGELVKSDSKTQSVNAEIGTIDTLNSLFTLETGVAGQLNLCFSANGYSDNKLVILGNKGSILFENETVKVMSGNEESSSTIYSFFDSYRNQFDDFYNCIRNGSKPVSTFEEGVKDLEFMMRLIG